MAGFVYIMSNPAFPNLLKIGMTTKDPATFRVDELNSTGVPRPFKCEYYAFVDDHERLEKMVHTALRHDRENDQREFFAVGCAKAINVIRDQANSLAMLKHEEVFYISPEDLILERQQREEQLKLEHEAIEKLAREHRKTQNKGNVAELEVQELQAKIDEVLEKQNYTIRFLNSCYLLLVIGAAFSSFYGALNFILYLIAAFACLFVIQIGLGIVTDGKVEKLKKQIKTKQKRPASPFTWAICIGVLFIGFLIYINGASID